MSCGFIPASRSASSGFRANEPRKPGVVSSPPNLPSASFCSISPPLLGKLPRTTYADFPVIVKCASLAPPGQRSRAFSRRTTHELHDGMTDHPPAGEARRVVTVLFSDVTGSTVLGEALDPESLRRLMSRYFQEMKAVLQRHGGTTEKFIGDAVMAVFGVPRLHEDDPLRAVRAALEMRDA